MIGDYKRNGTIDLFAPMNLAIGKVLTDQQKRHSAADVLRFFKLTHKDRRRWHLQVTPTSSSWLNLIEHWFKELTNNGYATVG